MPKSCMAGSLIRRISRSSFSTRMPLETLSVRMSDRLSERSIRKGRHMEISALPCQMAMALSRQEL